MKQQARDSYQKNKPFGKADLQNAGEQAQAAAQNDDSAPGASGLAAGASHLKEQASANVPEETKQKAEEGRNKTREQYERTKSYLSGKMPKERREQTIWRLKKMVVEIQGHQDCKLETYPWGGHDLRVHAS